MVFDILFKQEIRCLKISRKYYGKSQYWREIAVYNNLKIIERSSNSKTFFSVHLVKGQEILIPKR